LRAKYTQYIKNMVETLLARLHRYQKPKLRKPESKRRAEEPIHRRTDRTKSSAIGDGARLHSPGGRPRGGSRRRGGRRPRPSAWRPRTTPPRSAPRRPARRPPPPPARPSTPPPSPPRGSPSPAPFARQLSRMRIDAAAAVVVDSVEGLRLGVFLCVAQCDRSSGSQPEPEASPLFVPALPSFPVGCDGDGNIPEGGLSVMVGWAGRRIWAYLAHALLG
jgi:hypothetical protein